LHRPLCTHTFHILLFSISFSFFFFNDTATTEIYTLSLHDALPISVNVAAEDRNPFAGDPKAAKPGEFEFRINCAFCHGLGARGGGRGPDLTHAQKRHGSSDTDLFQNISNGIPGTAMPANGTNGQGVGMTD